MLLNSQFGFSMALRLLKRGGKLTREAWGDNIYVEIQNPEVLSLLADHGANVDKEKHHVHFTETLILKNLYAT